MSVWGLRKRRQVFHDRDVFSLIVLHDPTGTGEDDAPDATGETRIDHGARGDDIGMEAVCLRCLGAGCGSKVDDCVDIPECNIPAGIVTQIGNDSTADISRPVEQNEFVSCRR